MDLNKLKNKSDNLYSQALFALGWLIVGLGIIGSFFLASASYDFNGTIFFIGLLSSALSGFLILGIAEIINILNDNRRLLAAMTHNSEMTAGTDTVSKDIAEELPEI